MKLMEILICSQVSQKVDEIVFIPESQGPDKSLLNLLRLLDPISDKIRALITDGIDLLGEHFDVYMFLVPDLKLILSATEVLVLYVSILVLGVAWSGNLWTSHRMILPLLSDKVPRPEISDLRSSTANVKTFT